ncbi:transporter [Roseomonas sp. JC162]|uniref:Transporter n=1 Tax=Neoroseomonas marina TaxID=1232220 RepID=A0A848ECJ2_9PROT|nr:transporter [Neoroseomonas marina]NMJ41038.1 transporter [Neoroseomonas marina]
MPRVTPFRIACCATLLAAPALAQPNDADLAAQLANPVAALVSVPFQNNLDFGGGTGDAFRYTLNIQPVVPVTLTSDWNLIVRTILPVLYNERVYPDHRAGLGDITQSFFFSPARPVNGITWGVGPAFLYPTGTDGLGQRQWGAGPTGVVLRQSGPWIYGALVNHIWGLGGAPDGTQSANSSFLQPFINYVTPSQTTFFLNTETTYDWSRQQWTVPINAGVNQLVTIGEQRVQVGAGVRYYAEKPDGGPDWGIRLNLVFVFPR